MRLLIQRVSSASITIDGQVGGSIGIGVVCYLGVSSDYDPSGDSISTAIRRLLNIRLRKDDSGRLKRTIQDVGGSILIVSNFTLWGQIKKGTQLDFSKSGDYDTAQGVYNQFVDTLSTSYDTTKIITGKFGAMMEVTSVNDGPVNVIIDQ